MEKFINKDLTELFDEMLIELTNENNRTILMNYFYQIQNHLSTINHPLEFPLICFAVIRRIIDNEDNVLIKDFSIENYVESFLVFYKNARLLFNDLKLDGIDTQAHICKTFGDWWIENYRE